ncbi:MAG: tRNA lysidine(34) synthetase TilS [Candidatus Cryptobacteroides sp.]
MKYLLAVSGGIDSMYMVKRAQSGALFAFPVDFAVAHCNFNLRGEESEGDEAFVRDYCLREGIEFFHKSFDTLSFAREHKLSIEMAARHLRYDWFASLCQDYGFEATVVAHNADDNAETLLLNMLRGCGSKGLRGMAADAGVFPKRIIRPLLGISRQEILDFMTENQLPWREDSSNGEDHYKRNVLRHKVLPVFKELNPSCLKTLSKNMAHIREVDDICEDYYLEHKAAIRSIPELLSLKHWKYLLFRQMEELGFSEGAYQDLCRLLQSGETISGKAFYSSEYCLSLSSETLNFLPLEKALTADNCITVTGEGEYEISGRRFRISLIDTPSDLKAPKNCLYLSSSLHFPFCLRNWREADRMQLLGLKGSKKLSDLFVDLKIASHQKASEVVLLREENSSEVLALLCRRISEKMKVHPKADLQTILIEELTI